MALTDTEIRRSKPGDKPYKLSDGGGLHLMVTPSGGKLWRWKYRFEGAEKLMALGRYPEITLADARERRDAARKQLAKGIDPMAERKAEKTAVMVARNTPSRRLPSNGWSIGGETRASVTRRRPGTDSGRTSTPFLDRAPLPRSNRRSWSSWRRELKPEEPPTWQNGFSKLSAWCCATPLRTATANGTGIRNSSLGHSEADPQKEHGPHRRQGVAHSFAVN